LVDGAGTTDALPALQYQHTFAGASQICGTRESIVSGADDDHIP
jgi:hypothetical protein